MHISWNQIITIQQTTFLLEQCVDSIVWLTDLAMDGRPHSVLSSLVLCNRPCVSTLLSRTSTPNTLGFMGLGYFCIAALITVSHGWLFQTYETCKKSERTRKNFSILLPQCWLLPKMILNICFKLLVLNGKDEISFVLVYALTVQQRLGAADGFLSKLLGNGQNALCHCSTVTLVAVKHRTCEN